MILWTIQHQEAYTKMMQTGSLRADNRYLFCEDDFLCAYDWMAQQMQERISEPPTGVQYPVWLWHTWEGKRKRRDMRNTGYAMPGTPIVLLTVEIPDDKVLLSDFDLWHFVLNGIYIPENEEDDILHSEEEICKSWDRIFDTSTESHYYTDSLCIQATTWEIRKEWVKKAEFFTAR